VQSVREGVRPIPVELACLLPLHSSRACLSCTLCSGATSCRTRIERLTDRPVRRWRCAALMALSCLYTSFTGGPTSTSVTRLSHCQTARLRFVAILIAGTSCSRTSSRLVSVVVVLQIVNGPGSPCDPQAIVCTIGRVNVSHSSFMSLTSGNRLVTDVRSDVDSFLRDRFVIRCESQRHYCPVALPAGTGSFPGVAPYSVLRFRPRPHYWINVHSGQCLRLHIG